MWRRVACPVSLVCVNEGRAEQMLASSVAAALGRLRVSLEGEERKGVPASQIPLSGMTARRGRVLTQGPSQITRRRPR